MLQTFSGSAPGSRWSLLNSSICFCWFSLQNRSLFSVALSRPNFVSSCVLWTSSLYPLFIPRPHWPHFHTRTPPRINSIPSTCSAPQREQSCVNSSPLSGRLLVTKFRFRNDFLFLHGFHSVELRHQTLHISGKLTEHIRIRLSF